MPRLKAGQEAEIRFILNGQEVEGQAEPRMLLSDFLRQRIGASGTHVGCEHGVCGACTVRLNGRAIRSCLTLAHQASGASVETIEGEAGADGSFGILQRTFKKHFALQCGFCTPGILMSLADYLSRTDAVSEADIREVIGGHLCRCTGYAPIVKAALDAAQEFSRRRTGEQLSVGEAPHREG